VSLGGRAQLRKRYVRWTAVIAAVLVLLALLLLSGGHWILGVFFGVVAAVAVVVFLQIRTVR